MTIIIIGKIDKWKYIGILEIEIVLIKIVKIIGIEIVLILWIIIIIIIVEMQDNKCID